MRPQEDGKERIEGGDPLRHLPSPQAVVLLVLAAIASLVAASLAQDLLAYAGIIAQSARAWRLDIDAEGTLYAWFSSSVILVNALLLGLIALEERARPGGMQRRWMGLALIFMVLSADESLALHETVLRHLREGSLPAGLVTGLTWGGMLASLVLVLAYLPFLLRLPHRVRAWMMAAGGVFVGGALGIDMLGEHVAGQAGMTALSYRLVATFEETLEGVGMAMFLYALLLYRQGTAKFRLAPPPATGEQP